MCEVIAVANQKGGVGKTTTAINLATALSVMDKRVLLLDLDPQGNSSTGVGISVQDRKNNIYNVLIGKGVLLETIKHTLIAGLDIIPCTTDLAAAEIELSHLPNQERQLKNKLQSIITNYDYIIVDCPPSLGLLTVNALVASNFVLIPVQCEFFALEGLVHLLNTIKKVKNYLNARLAIIGILLTMVDRRSRLSYQIESEIRELFPKLVYNTVIPRNVKLSEAPSHGQPAIIYSTKCLGTLAYLELAKELSERINEINEEKNDKR